MHVYGMGYNVILLGPKADRNALNPDYLSTSIMKSSHANSATLETNISLRRTAETSTARDRVLYRRARRAPSPARRLVRREDK